MRAATQVLNKPLVILVLIDGRVQAVHTFRRPIVGPNLHGARVSRMYSFALENAECQNPSAILLTIYVACVFLGRGAHQRISAEIRTSDVRSRFLHMKYAHSRGTIGPADQPADTHTLDRPTAPRPPRRRLHGSTDTSARRPPRSGLDLILVSTYYCSFRARRLTQIYAV